MVYRLFRHFSIRAKLFLVALVLLVIPWLGYYYVTEMKSFLLQGQEQALILMAKAIATVLHDREELFDPETGVPKILGGQSNLYAHPLSNFVSLDGDRNDWEEQWQNAVVYTGDEPFLCTADFDEESLRFSHILGHYNRYLYAYFDVGDDQTIYRSLKLRRLNNSDHIRLMTQNPGGAVRRYLFTAQKPGAMSVYLVDKDWKYPLSGDPVKEMNAVLAENESGYTVELRIPRYMISSYTRVGFAVADVDNEEEREVDHVIATAPSDKATELSRLFVHSPEIDRILRGLDRPLARTWILDDKKRVRAVMGGFTPLTGKNEESLGFFDRSIDRILAVFYQTGNLQNSDEENLTEMPTSVAVRQEAIFNQVLETGVPQAERRQASNSNTEILMAAHPIWSSSNNLLGAVVVEQSSNQVLALQDRVIKNVVLASLIIFIIAAAALFTFASRLTLRIGRLRNATERSITAEGRVRQQQISAEQESGDEIGDLSRSISDMLQRLSQYTRYLEGLPDTLAHEFNNPLNVVNSSLDNLQKEIPDTEGSKYMQRAQNGILRMRSLLTNLTEAANLEDAMHGETWERFDLVELVKSYVEGYRYSHPDWEFGVEVLDQPLRINGTPDHIAQMLDKLADNAVDFANPESTIIFRLQKEGDTAVLIVLNEGPELPAQLRDRVFDPMVSAGKKNAKQSQLGMGLYIVRLIASFHQAKVSADNRSDVRGVSIRVIFPLRYPQ